MANEPLIDQQIVTKTAEELYWECFPHFYGNGFFMKDVVAKDYAKKIVKRIIKETLEEYTNDENHDRVLFWQSVLQAIDVIK